MTVQPRVRVLLGLLVGVAAIAVVSHLSGSWGGEGATSERPRPARRSEASGREPTKLAVVELRSDELRPSTAEFRPGRDPWRFGATPVVAPPTAPPPPVVPTQRAVVPPPVVPPVPARPRPPDVDVVYLGSFGPASRKIAVFSDREVIYNAASGDVIKEKFEVHQIGFESVDLKFVGFPDEPPKRLEAGG